MRRQTVTFELDEQIEAVALAQLGFSNAYIASKTGLGKGQIQYLLTKAKTAERYKSGVTYRSTYKDGTSAVARAVIKGWALTLKSNARQRLPKLFERPTAEVVER